MLQLNFMILVVDIPTNNNGNKAYGAMSMQITNELKERERKISNVVFAGNITEEKICVFTQAATNDGVERPSKK